MENPLLILQEILMKTQHVQQAAIVDSRSNMVKAASRGFTVRNLLRVTKNKIKMFV